MAQNICLLEGNKEGCAKPLGSPHDEQAPLKGGLLEGDEEGCAKALGNEKDEGGPLGIGLLERDKSVCVDSEEEDAIRKVIVSADSR